jgi:hypothetical protein
MIRRAQTLLIAWKEKTDEAAGTSLFSPLSVDSYFGGLVV